ncbi:unnamed protein product, partial [Polarella glacialis]
CNRRQGCFGRSWEKPRRVRLPAASSEQSDREAQLAGRTTVNGTVAKDAEDRKMKDEQEELERLRASAAASWMVNIILIVWILWLFERQSRPSSERDAIASLLVSQLEEERAALDSDNRLNEDLRREQAQMAAIEESIQDTTPSSGDLLMQQLWQRVRDLRQQVNSEQSLLAERDEQLSKTYELTSRDLRDARWGAEASRGLVDDVVLGPATSTASGVLAGLDISFASEALVLAVLLSAAAVRSRPSQQQGQGQDPGSMPEVPPVLSAAEEAASAVENEALQRSLRSKAVLRFYGRWDDEQEWVLVQSIRLKGASESVVRWVRNSRSWLGSWSNRILTLLVTRSARGMVRRRGWTRIVTQTMDEVGRKFFLGYLVETAADRAEPRIAVNSGGEKQVLE